MFYCTCVELFISLKYFAQNYTPNLNGDNNNLHALYYYYE